jgi:hypothetical protein
MQTMFKIAISLISLIAITAAICLGQDAAPKSVRVLGEVTAVDEASLTIKTDAGASTAVLLDPKTSYLRIPPGETDLKKASQIEFKDVSIGDRVLARGRVGEDQKPGPATSVIVMTKADITRKQETEKLEWQRRGVSGTIKAINPDTKEVTVSARLRGETKDVVVEASGKAQYRRYSPDSIRFSDAKPSLFADLKVGDQMRVLGEKNADGTRIKPEMVVSGSFHNIAGTITTVDAASGEIKINNLQTKKPLIVKVNADSTLKRVPAEMGAILARMQQGGGQGAPGMAGGAGRASGGPEGAAPGAGPNAAGAAAAGTPGNGMIPGGRMGGRGGDFSQMVERMPVFSLSELKQGDAIIVASSVGPDPNRITAITLLAGVEPLLTGPAGQGNNRQLNGSWNFDINIVP